MSMMSIEEVANYLGVQPIRVERLEREHLLIAKSKSEDANPFLKKMTLPVINSWPSALAVYSLSHCLQKNKKSR